MLHSYSFVPQDFLNPCYVLSKCQWLGEEWDMVACSRGWGPGGRVNSPTNKQMQWNVGSIPEVIAYGARKSCHFHLWVKMSIWEKDSEKRWGSGETWNISRCLSEKRWEKHFRKRYHLSKGTGMCNPWAKWEDPIWLHVGTLIMPTS